MEKISESWLTQNKWIVFTSYRGNNCLITKENQEIKVESIAFTTG
jgi:hypothetical protein